MDGGIELAPEKDGADLLLAVEDRVQSQMYADCLPDFLYVLPGRVVIVPAQPGPWICDQRVVVIDRFASGQSDGSTLGPAEKPWNWWGSMLPTTTRNSASTKRRLAQTGVPRDVVPR